MKAVAIFEHGGVEKLTLTDLPRPSIGPDEVLINVKAVAMNHLDLWVREGLPGLKLEFPFTLGSDAAGVIAEVGSRVRDPSTGSGQALQVGQRVTINPGWWCGRCEYCLSGQECLCVEFKIFGEHLPGGYAEFMRVPARNVLPIPDDFSFEEAAAVPLAFLTAWRALITQARVMPGDDVLILGVGGGVASAAVQIAKLAGARVFAASSSDAKLKRAQELGADILINSKEKEFEREVWQITSKRGVDVVFDSIGAATWFKSMRALRKGGRLVTVGATSGPNPTEEIRLIFAKQISIIGSTMSTQKEFRDVMKLVFRRQLKPVIDKIFPLEEARAAHERLARGEQFGKIVLKVS